MFSLLYHVVSLLSNSLEMSVFISIYIERQREGERPLCVQVAFVVLHKWVVQHGKACHSCNSCVFLKAQSMLKQNPFNLHFEQLSQLVREHAGKLSDF